MPWLLSFATASPANSAPASMSFRHSCGQGEAWVQSITIRQLASSSDATNTRVITCYYMLFYYWCYYWCHGQWFPLEQKSWIIINPNDVEQWTTTETVNRCMMFEDTSLCRNFAPCINKNPKLNLFQLVRVSAKQEIMIEFWASTHTKQGWSWWCNGIEPVKMGNYIESTKTRSLVSWVWS